MKVTLGIMSAKDLLNSKHLLGSTLLLYQPISLLDFSSVSVYELLHDFVRGEHAACVLARLSPLQASILPHYESVVVLRPLRRDVSSGGGFAEIRI